VRNTPMDVKKLHRASEATFISDVSQDSMSSGQHLKLKGQMLLLDDRQHLIYLCSPYVTSIPELLQFGMRLTTFERRRSQLATGGEQRTVGTTGPGFGGGKVQNGSSPEGDASGNGGQSAHQRSVSGCPGVRRRHRHVQRRSQLPVHRAPLQAQGRGPSSQRPVHQI
uniref:Guanylate cyclase n=1 Tax=Panagrolaimus sp. JU765 TaxID=591449 RepID=A0AC34Q7H1_9BILA